MAGRDFDAEVTSTDEISCQFKLGGRQWACRPAGQIPFGIMADFLGADTNIKAMLQAGPFFRGVLVRDQIEDFTKQILEAPDSPLSMDNVGDVMQYVSEHVFTRPTERSATSEAGPQKTGRSSKGGSSSRATPKRQRAS